MLAVNKMNRFILIALSIIFIIKTNAQTSTQCNCGAIVDVGFKGKVAIYDKPNGRIIKSLQNDIQNEDYLILTIDNDSLNFFHVDISNAERPENSKVGWIKKTKKIGTYARNYQQNDTLFLYFKPELTSKIQSVISGWTNELYTITKCFKSWAYVKIRYKGKIKEGWLQPDKQCDNPYTTCN